VEAMLDKDLAALYGVNPFASRNRKNGVSEDSFLAIPGICRENKVKFLKILGRAREAERAWCP